jgi:hypothetical protein
VRNVTATLGCSLADRLRCSGMWAFRGLPSYWSLLMADLHGGSSGGSGHTRSPHGGSGGRSGGGGKDAGGGDAAAYELSEVDRRFTTARYRLNIRARILAIRGYVAVNTALNRLLLATLHMFGQPVVMY